MLLFLNLLLFIGLSAGLVWYLLSNDRGEKEPVDALWVAVALGVTGALLAGFIESKVIQPDNLHPLMPHNTIFTTAMMVGFIEEFCKFVPLAIFIYKKRYFNEYTDGVIYFALAGLAFGLPENILYTLQYGTDAGFLRLALTPFFHAAATATVGYFLIKYKLSGKSPFKVIIPLILISALHGFYDFALSTGTSVYIMLAIGTTLCLSAGLFAIYLKANNRDQELGLSTVGHNTFCRSCGHPNPHKNLYCSHCGKNA